MADWRRAGSAWTRSFFSLDRDAEEVPQPRPASPLKPASPRSDQNRPASPRQDTPPRPPEPVSWLDRHGVDEAEARSYLPQFMAAQNEYRAKVPRGWSLRPPPAERSWPSLVAAGVGEARVGAFLNPKTPPDPPPRTPEEVLRLYEAEDVLNEGESYALFSKRFTPRPYPIDDAPLSVFTDPAQVRRDSLAHYTQEYDRAAKIHSALWREVRPKPAPPFRLIPDPAHPDLKRSGLTPSDRANAFLYRQPDTGAPVSDPLLKTGASQSTAPLGPFAQPLSNRLDSNRAESAQPVSSSVTARRDQRGRAAADARAEEAAEAKAEQDKRDIRPYEVAAAEKAAVYREAIRRRDIIQNLLSNAERDGDPDQRAPGIRKDLNKAIAEVEANSPVDDFERDIFAKTERVETFITAAGLLMGGRGARAQTSVRATPIGKSAPPSGPAPKPPAGSAVADPTKPAPSPASAPQSAVPTTGRGAVAEIAPHTPTPYSGLPRQSDWGPGPYAKEYVVGAPGQIGPATAAQRRAVNEIGKRHGCHRCGSKDPGTKSKQYAVDHQPSIRVLIDDLPKDTPVRFYPHCIGCSNKQGNIVRFRKAK
ncbi:MAG: hypothetical protein QNJ84_07595 [Alphaproteobacteria bacterium]|nr:hypothetical protein [Alphaproteobacteria bacterium]